MNNDSLEKRLNSYAIPDALMDRFHNIMNFSKNMTLKDSKFYYRTENPISEKLSSYLLKYFSAGLLDNEIIDLLKTCLNYNKTIDSRYDYSNLQIIFSEIYGLKYKVDNYETDLQLNKNWEESREKIMTDISYETSFIKLLYDDIIETTKLEIDENNFFDRSINTISKKELLINERSQNIFPTEEMTEELKDYFSTTKLLDLYNLEKALLNSKKIQIFKKVVDESEIKNNKRSASSVEKGLAEAGEHLIFFDLKINKINIDEEDRVLIKDYLQESNSANTNSSLILQFQLLYKELNPLYRNLLNSDMIDLISALQYNNIEDSLNSSFNSVTTNSVKYPRSVADNIIIRDFYEDEKLVATTKLFKYLYTNAYIARAAAESEIIAYYVGDEYISNGYGRFSFEKAEINNFIEIFKETRTYYYRVLLNESFTNEEEYSAYEKIMLISYAVIRFMANKIDTLKDIDSFDRNDIQNFLETFGMKSLSDVLELSDFINSEAYAKNILKNYINLVQNKGSRDVVKLIEEIFTLGNTELTIYKMLLVGYIKRDDDGIRSKNYNFVRLNYEDDDILNDIKESSSKINLQDFVSKDKYWDYENTTTELLNDLNVSVANTKYINPEITIELSAPYAVTRALFALVDWLITVNSEKWKPEEIKLENFDGFTNDVSLLEYINSIRFLWFKYITMLDPNFKLDSSTRSYKINENILNEDFEIENGIKLKDFYYIDKNNDDAIYINEDKLKTVLGSHTTYASTTLGSLSTLFNADIIRPSLKDILSFVDRYIKGYFNTAYQISYKEYEFINKIFSTVFLSEETPDIMNQNDKDIVSDTSNKFASDFVDLGNKESIRLAIVKLCNGLTDFLEDDEIIISLAMAGKDETFIKFLKNSIEYFISYTSEIYDFSYKNSYNTLLEMPNVIDGYKFDITSTEIDSFFYDEKLIIQEESNNG